MLCKMFCFLRRPPQHCAFCSPVGGTETGSCMLVSECFLLELGSEVHMVVAFGNQQLANPSGCERAALGVLLRIRRPYTVLPRPGAAFGILEEVRRDIAEAVGRRPRPGSLAAGCLRAGAAALASVPARGAWRDGARQVQVASRVFLVEAFPRAFLVPADDLGGAGSPMVPRLSRCQNTTRYQLVTSGWGGGRSGCGAHSRRDVSRSSGTLRPSPARRR